MGCSSFKLQQRPNIPRFHYSSPKSPRNTDIGPQSGSHNDIPLRARFWPSVYEPRGGKGLASLRPTMPLTALRLMQLEMAVCLRSTNPLPPGGSFESKHIFESHHRWGFEMPSRRLSRNCLAGGWWKAPRCKASEFLRNEAVQASTPQ